MRRAIELAHGVRTSTSPNPWVGCVLVAADGQVHEGATEPPGGRHAEIVALEAAGRPVPAYLRDAVDELRPHDTERVAFGMHCYWSGEACLGEIPGVLSTRAGYAGGGEAVEVVFDAERLSLAELAGHALRRGCADRILYPFAHQEQAARAVYDEEAARYGARGSMLVEFPIGGQSALEKGLAILKNRKWRG